MNYTKIYNTIINKANNNNRQKHQGTYYELHHIKPKCIQGTDDSNNLVLLTAKEHFVCHHLLTKIYPESPGIIKAFWMMLICTSKNQNRIINNSNTYSLTKNYISKIQRKIFIDYNKTNPKIGDKNGMYGVHRYGELNPFYGKIHTKSTKEKISIANSGKIRTEENKEKLRKVWSNRENIQCPYCNKISRSIGNMNRYHFDKCKLRDV